MKAFLEYLRLCAAGALAGTALAGCIEAAFRAFSYTSPDIQWWGAALGGIVIAIVCRGVMNQRDSGE